MKTTPIIIFLFLAFQISAQEYIIKIAGMPPGNIDYDRALRADFLTVEGPDNPQLMRFQIVFFKSGIENVEISYSNKLTDNQKKLLRDMDRNSTIEIEKIRIKTDKRIIDLPRVSFRLSYYVDESLDFIALAGLNDGNISKQAVLNDPVIRLNQDIGIIISFSLTANIPGYTYKLTSNSDKLTPAMINAIKNLKIWARFVITNTKIKKYDNAVITANDAVFKIR